MTTPAAAPARRRRAALAITLGVVVVLLIGFFLFAGLYTDALWFTQLGFQGVLYTEWVTIASLFVVGFVAMAAPVVVTIQLAYRLRPVYAKLTAQLDRYQQVIEPLRRVVMIGVPVIVGLFAGVSAAARWQPVLLLLHAQHVGGRTDPVFHLDAGFYLFTLPALHGIVGFASAVLVVCAIAALATSYLYGSIRIVGRDVRVARPARIQVAVTVALFLIVQAVSLYLDQFTTLYDDSSDGLITGAGYAEVNAVIPGRLILAVCALIVAALFVVTAFIGRWRLPLIGIALLVVASVIVGSVFPWGVWNLEVKPNLTNLESAFAKHAIDATRTAYGLTDVDQQQYDATTTTQSGALRADAQTTANIRILDPSVVSPTFAQFQQFKQYYTFSDPLDVDRYDIRGTSQDAVVAVRELNQAGLQNPTAFNDTFVYTHGYGLVAAYGNQRSDDGAPVFFQSNIPSKGSLDITQPQIYFGEKSPQYSVVGAPKGSKPIELDYVSGNEANGQQQNTTYSATGTGNGGPSVGNLFNRLVYALKFSSDQILLSNSVNQDSQILYDRDPLTRVQKVAPYLTLDQDPYPSVVKGHIVWIVDGYTTSSTYPYSAQQSLSTALANSNSDVAPYATDQVNYIRNSVKATVDAYTGKVTLYTWDAKDPVLKAWQSVFPSTVRPISDMSGELMSHVRYPEDLFKVQRAVLGRYHVTEPTSWIRGDDEWKTPSDSSNSADTDQSSLEPPYFLTMKLPGQSDPTFSLYSTYIPNSSTNAASRGNLTGYLAVDSDAGSAAGTKRGDYGKLRLLVLPRDTVVNGPTQVQAQFQSDTTIKSQLNLLNIGGTNGSSVTPGNLLTIPVGGGLLYVEPVYVKSSSASAYPLLRKVLTAFGTKVQIADTLDDSLNALFGGDSGTTTPDSNTGGTTPTTPPSTGSGTSKTNNAALQKALGQARDALAEREQAYKDNDLVAAAQADKKLQTAIAAAIAAEGD